MKERPQLRLDLLFTAEDLRDTGIKMALDHAEEKAPTWGERCFQLLLDYMKINNQPFMVEYFRQWTEGKIEDPPSKRAFGGIITKAAKAGLVKQVGWAKTSNYKAHKTPAAVWVAIDHENINQEICK